MMIKELFTGKAKLKDNPEKKLTFQLKEGSVTTEKIADKAVTPEKLSVSTIATFQKMVDGTLNADKNSLANVGYYECNTNSSEQVKTIASDYYQLVTGGAIKIKMTNANLYDGEVKLKIGEEVAKPLYYNSYPVSNDNKWSAGETLVVYYDGQVYQGFGIDSLISKYISEAETSFHEYVDGVATVIQERIDEILGTGDETQDIDTFGEVTAFLAGITNDKTLQGLFGDERDAREKGDSDNRSRIDTVASNLGVYNRNIQNSINEVSSNVTTLQENLAENTTRIEELEEDVNDVKELLGSAEEEGTITERIGNLESQMDTKVDKEDGKSLIDASYASEISFDSSLEYMKIITDSEGHILWGITKTGDIKYGYGVPEQIKEYVNSEIGDEVSRALAAEKELQDNMMIEVDSRPAPSKDTLDHIYLVPVENPTDTFTKEKWITVTSTGVKFSDDGKGYSVKNMSEDARDWTENLDLVTSASPGIYLNKDWNGNMAWPQGYIPTANDYAGVLREAGEMAGTWNDSNLSVQYGQVYFMQAEAALHTNDCYWMATPSGWKVYQPSDGIIDDSIMEGTVYSWEKITNNTPELEVSSLTVGTDLKLLEDSDVSIIQTANNVLFVDTPMSVFSGEVDIQSSLYIEDSPVKKGSTYTVTATGRSMNYTVGTMHNGETDNIFFVHHTDDVGNTEHTVNITAGSKTLSVTFQASSYCEVCVTKISDTYFLREIPAGV